MRNEIEKVSDKRVKSYLAMKVGKSAWIDKDQSSPGVNQIGEQTQVKLLQS